MDLFFAAIDKDHPVLVTSDDRPEEVGRWDQVSRAIGDCAGAGLFFSIVKTHD